VVYSPVPMRPTEMGASESDMVMVLTVVGAWLGKESVDGVR
jgi:hypothetical protein